jgi:hypothetical protein
MRGSLVTLTYRGSLCAEHSAPEGDVHAQSRDRVHAQSAAARGAIGPEICCRRQDVLRMVRR